LARQSLESGQSAEAHQRLSATYPIPRIADRTDFSLALNAARASVGFASGP
jgi:hypothetical protein